jgi:hypothetical protein
MLRSFSTDERTYTKIFLLKRVANKYLFDILETVFTISTFFSSFYQGQVCDKTDK